MSKVKRAVPLLPVLLLLTACGVPAAGPARIASTCIMAALVEAACRQRRRRARRPPSWPEARRTCAQAGQTACPSFWTRPCAPRRSGFLQSLLPGVRLSVEGNPDAPITGSELAAAWQEIHDELTDG